MKFSYQPKWKEELVGTYGEYIFVVEMTMGISHVYFPTESTWEDSSPPWAKGKWFEAKEAAQSWSTEQNIPFTVDKSSWVVFND